MSAARDDAGHRAPVLRVAALAGRIRRDQAELAASLQSAYAAGASLRSLAVAAGISHEQVRRIVHDGPRPGVPAAADRHIL